MGLLLYEVHVVCHPGPGGMQHVSPPQHQNSQALVLQLRDHRQQLQQTTPPRLHLSFHGGPGHILCIMLVSEDFIGINFDYQKELMDCNMDGGRGVYFLMQTLTF